MTKPAFPSAPAQPHAGQAVLLRVFVDATAPHGGNPVPLVLDAQGMTAGAMQALAAQRGHESSFVLPADQEGHLCRLRFFVPGHEMEMCGHATVGTLWALRQWNRWTTPRTRVQTLSGSVDVEWHDAGQRAWVSQPAVTTTTVTPDAVRAIAKVLRIDPDLPGLHTINASTSRVKTLIRLPSAAALDALAPDFTAVRDVCEAIGSTGLYPYALTPDGASARQFPKSSGYPEDAATGIAAAALWGFLNETNDVPADGVFTVRQGVAMGSPSVIQLRRRGDAPGCWLGGDTQWMT